MRARSGGVLAEVEGGCEMRTDDFGHAVAPRRRSAAALVAAGVCAGLVLTAAPSQAVVPGDNGRIAFTTNRDGNFEVYAVDADGTNPVNLTNHPNADVEAAWSPDGTKLAFATDRDGNAEVYVVNADGTNPVNLTNHPGVDFRPAWSPDGTKLAFTTLRDGNFEVYVVNADGTNPVNLTNHPGFDDSSKWSPDGTKLAFTTNRADDFNQEVYVIDADGTNPVNLTNHPSADVEPAWSPDGTKLAFTTNRDGNFEVYVINADGTNPVNITNNPGQDNWPDWQSVVADDDGDGVVDGDDVCPDTVLPDDITGLKNNRYAAEVDGEFRDASSAAAGYTLEDTGGCSATQIIAAAGLGAGHTRFGITSSALNAWVTSLA